MKKDLDEIAKIEKAIKEKYGEQAIQNPKKFWDEEKEKKYLSELQEFYKNKSEKKQTIESDGFLIKERKTNRKVNRTCPTCGTFSFRVKDDLYMSKFECCFECYVKYVEGREERWKNGLRP